MKKYLEYIILAAVALASLLYIGFRDTSRINYDLPSFRMISRDDFTKLEISGRKDVPLTLEKKDSGWLLSDGDYAADTGRINRLLDAVEEVVPVDLVSESSNHSRYDLDEEKRLTLKAWNGERLVREIYFGKLSTSGNYNYVLFPGDENVYTLRGNLSSILESDINSFRSKNVMNLNRNDVIKIEYTAEGTNRIITKSGDDKWTDQEGAELAPDKTNTLLGTLSNLNCQEFLDTKPSGNSRTIKLAASTGEYTLQLFDKTDKGFPGISSSHNHPFLLTEYTGNRILEVFQPENETDGE